MSQVENQEQSFEIDLGGKKIILETGWVAKQSSGSVIIKSGDSLILSTCVMSPDVREGQDFFPLTVEYKEKFYAAGRIPGGFIKREGKPREKEVLISRLIDRPLRPLFPEGFLNEVQVMTQVLSSDPSIPSDVLSITVSSAALMISEIPFNGPVAGVRVGRINGNFVLNPSFKELEESDLDLVVAGTDNAVLMIEGVSKFVSEEDMISAVEFAHVYIKQLCELQKEIAAKVAKDKYEIPEGEDHSQFIQGMENKYEGQLFEACFITEKQARIQALEAIVEAAKNSLPEEDDTGRALIPGIIHDLEKKIVRREIIENGKRIDGRGLKDVRNIDIRLGLLPRAHGSALFTRGQTQSLGVVTLGTQADMQRTDDLEGESSKGFMLHYNFPSFSVGEVRKNIGPGRREIGHGNLAERALENIVPSMKDFPYTIRLVSDIMESNGSSSMASVCSGCLAMAQAGVPIKETVAGVAMGLVLNDDGRYSILTDISGTEDHLGDMDFKVAGSENGITSFQMDIKVEGITPDIMRDALAHAKEARHFILEKMIMAIPKPAETLSDFAPRITTIQINTEKIGELIGPGGRNVRAIMEQSGAEINIEDSGVVTVAANNQESSSIALDLIRATVEDLQVGRIYEGKVKRIMEYGAFVEVGPGKEGLCHISKLDRKRVKAVRDVVKEGDIIKVKVLGVDDRSGKIDLSRRDALDD